jgi:nucleoside transporter
VLLPLFSVTGAIPLYCWTARACVARRDSAHPAWQALAQPNACAFGYGRSICAACGSLAGLVFSGGACLLGRVQRSIRSAPFADLSALFFLQAAAMGAWFVPLGAVLDAHGFQAIKSFAFATSATAAFVSPLIFGAMADRRVAPVRVLRGLALATAAAMALAAMAIEKGASPWVVLALIQLHALCTAPTWGISSAIVLGRLSDSQRQFGPIRALGTLGWMAGCWMVSALRADTSTLACYAAACVWLLVAGFTLFLSGPAPANSTERLTIRQRLGLDALALLKNHDHRVVFLTTALFAIPISAFYPFTPAHLRQLGLERTAAWMTLGQVTEIIAMIALSRVMGRWRLKETLAAGLACGLVRFGLCTLNGRGWVLAGVLLHGFSFTLVFITAQIYLDRRIDPGWRARSQALLSLMTGGVGNLIGYLGNGLWFGVSQRTGVVDWPLFWAGPAAVAGLVFACFLATYRGSAPEQSTEK